MRIRTTSLLLLAGLTAGFAAHAGEPAKSKATGHFAGVSVAIDPATGRLRAPTASELAALRAKAPRGDSNMSIAKPGPKTRAEAARTMRHHKNGMVTMQTSEDMLSHVVATRKADGSIVIQHADADGNIIDGGAAHE